MIDKRVLIISAWLPGGGIERVISNLINDKIFETIHIFNLSNVYKYKWFKNFNKNFQSSNVYKNEKNLNIIFSFKQRKKIKQAIHSNHDIESYDYYLITHSFLLPIVKNVASLNINKIIFWPHNNLLTNKISLKWLGKYLYFRLLSNSCTGIICVNEKIYEEARKIGFRNFELCYNPIGESNSNFFEFNNESNRICHLAYLTKRKNTKFLIEALSKSNNSKITIDIIGDGPMLGKLKRTVNNCNLNDRVIFHGFQDESFLQGRSYKALIMASKSEGFSMSISDALRSGLPIIIPERLSLATFVENENTGLTFSLDNHKSLINVLQNIDEIDFEKEHISNKYINTYGKIAYEKRIRKLLIETDKSK